MRLGEGEGITQNMGPVIDYLTEISPIMSLSCVLPDCQWALLLTVTHGPQFLRL